MTEYIVGGVISLVFGAALSSANYLVARRLLRKNNDRIAVSSILRQTLNIAYLVAIYFLSNVLPWPLEAMLVGGALGVTVPSFFFAARLARDMRSPAGESKAEREND